MNYSFLTGTALFKDISPEEIHHMLHCFRASEKNYRKGEIIYHAGDSAECLGLILEGSVLIENDDLWGSKSILDQVGKGQIFAETYAMIPGEPLMVSVTAACVCRVLFLNVRKLTQPCPSACSFHQRIVQNLLRISAQKNLNLSQRIFFTSSKSIRGRLVSYLSHQAKKSGSCEFTIPFNRQQMADYLGVDRSALSKELSKMKKEGVLTYKKNAFHMIV